MQFLTRHRQQPPTARRTGSGFDVPAAQLWHVAHNLHHLVNAHLHRNVWRMTTTWLSHLAAGLEGDEAAVVGAQLVAQGLPAKLLGLCVVAACQHAHR